METAIGCRCINAVRLMGLDFADGSGALGKRASVQMGSEVGNLLRT